MQCQLCFFSFCDVLYRAFQFDHFLPVVDYRAAYFKQGFDLIPGILYPEFAAFTLFAGSQDFYIADNTFEGPLKLDFTDYSHKGNIGDEANGIWWSGSGHVICHNRFTHWWDAIHGSGGVPATDRALQASATSAPIGSSR